MNKEVNEKLEYKSASKIYMNGEKLSSEKLEGLLKSESNIYNQYKKGKNGASLGNILLGGGIGLFIGGGINNMMQADSDSQGSPALLIIGIATSAIGIPVKLGGVKNLKEAINNYNSLPKKSVSFLEESELKFIASTNGIGFQFRF